MSVAKCVWIFFGSVLLLASANHRTASAQSAALDVLHQVGIDQRLNQSIPLDLAFRDETGKEVRLQDYFNGQPVVLVLAYYRCPMLCTEVLNGLTKSLQAIPLTMDQQYRVVTVSFDPKELPELAAEKKTAYVKSYGKPGAATGWHFLTGDQVSIDRLTQAVGFRYAYDPALDQFAHASGIVVLTPEGKIARYFFGIEYPPRDLRLALVEASAGKIGSTADQLLLLCFHYDESTGRYTPSIMGFIRLGGVITLAVVGIWIGRVWLHDWRLRSKTVANESF
jgi:protein SCO1/2